MTGIHRTATKMRLWKTLGIWIVESSQSIGHEFIAAGGKRSFLWSQSSNHPITRGSFLSFCGGSKIKSVVALCLSLWKCRQYCISTFPCSLIECCENTLTVTFCANLWFSSAPSCPSWFLAIEKKPLKQNNVLKGRKASLTFCSSPSSYDIRSSFCPQTPLSSATRTHQLIIYQWILVYHCTASSSDTFLSMLRRPLSLQLLLWNFSRTLHTSQ